jgi:hypothetical protein
MALPSSPSSFSPEALNDPSGGIGQLKTFRGTAGRRAVPRHLRRVTPRHHHPNRRLMRVPSVELAAARW